jgi:flavin-dependent dehydrogenase
MTEAERREVIVIGGGPAGSTAAALLARRGHDVLLLERERFPRDHVGESMLPFCFSLFDDLGLLPKLRSAFVRKPGVRFISGDGSQSTYWCFRHVIHDESYLSFQVNRSEFDTILLDNAERLGAQVRQGTKVTQVDVADPRQATVTSVDADGVQRTHVARFVVDGSGRDAVIGTRHGWKKPREELDRTAVWSHWTGVELVGGLEEGLSVIVYLGEQKKGWIWVFPLAEDRITAGAVFNNAYMREQRRRLAEAGAADWRRDLMYQELRQAPFVAALLNGARQALPVLVNGDYSYEVSNQHGPNYAMVGDARGFIDPIFSSGVYLSMKTAQLVADAVHTTLTIDRGRGASQMAEAYRKVTGAYGFVHRMIRLFYSPHAITWAEVGAERQVHLAHESAMAAGHFMLSGDFFENHERYDRFFELLEDPIAFRRYVNLVLRRERFSATSCDAGRELVFADVGRAVEELVG